MTELEIAHRLRTMAAEMDDLSASMKMHHWKNGVWRERSEDIKDGAVHARQWATYIERENAP